MSSAISDEILRQASDGKSVTEPEVDESNAVEEIAKIDAKLDSIIHELDLKLIDDDEHPSKPHHHDGKQEYLSQIPNIQMNAGRHTPLDAWADFNDLENNGGNMRTRRTTLDRVDLSLGDISNPLQNEAENAIIRALEAREWENYRNEDDLQFLQGMNAASGDLDISSTYVFGTEPGTNIAGQTQNPSPPETEISSASSTANSIGTTKLEDFPTSQLNPSISEWEHRSTRNIAVGDTSMHMLDEEAQHPLNYTTTKSVKIVSHPVVINQENGNAFAGTTKKLAETTTNDSKSQYTRSSIWNNAMFGRNSMKTKRLLKNSKEMVEELHWSLRFKSFLKRVMIYAVFPGLIVSAVLFYAAGNPMVGEVPNSEVTPNDASYSWWILFIVRQVIILCVAKITEIVIIEILTLRIQTFQRLMGSFGSFVALSLIQSRGWPYIITFWAILDFCFLQGKRKFAMHWLYYTNIKWFKMCTFVRQNYGIVNGQFIPPDIRLEGTVTDCNPAGNAVFSDLYKRVLIGAIVLGCAVTLKRVLFGIYVGKKATATYVPQLEKVMAKMVIIGEVAHLAREIWQNNGKNEGASQYKTRSTIAMTSAFCDSVVSEQDDINSAEDDASTESIQSKDSHNFSNPECMTQIRNSIKDTEIIGDLSAFQKLPTTPDRGLQSQSTSHKFKVSEMVGVWEEPVVNEKKSLLQRISVQDLLAFRRAVYGLDKQHPFSYAFGPADTRQSCLESAEKVYKRLLLYTPGESNLTFSTIALVATHTNGETDEKKVKKLIRMFRPDRNGEISALAFVKSCDKVYKQLRTLRAAIINSSQIDDAFEKILNVFFYFAIIAVLLAIVRVDPWPLIASSSAFVLGFSFMFSKAASKYFDGILLILVQQPFDIGDRIHLSDPKQDTSSNGSSTWIVEEVALHSTTLRFATTNEVATFSNGVLADLRIINANRSPKATVYVYNKFGSDVPFEKVMLFKSAIESFVNARPSQWIAMNGFRSTRLEADRGFIEYVIVLTHVEKWQNVGVILNSKAELSSYCLEVQRQLGMKYEAPPLPVNLGLVDSHGEKSFFELEQFSKEQGENSEPDFDKLATLFSESGMRKRK